MENVKLIFNGTLRSATDDVALEVYANGANEIVFWLEDNDERTMLICLNKITAVRLVKELKKQIGYIESEVDNG